MSQPSEMVISLNIYGFNAVIGNVAHYEQDCCMDLDIHVCLSHRITAKHLVILFVKGL